MSEPNAAPAAATLPTQLLIRDETGQPWAISVRADGQLQTAKLPDGKPIVMARLPTVASVSAVVAECLESFVRPPSLEELEERAAHARSQLNDPNLEAVPRAFFQRRLDDCEREIKRL